MARAVADGLALRQVQEVQQFTLGQLFVRRPVASAGRAGLLALPMALRRAPSLQRQHERLHRRTQTETERLEALLRERTVLIAELAQHLQTARCSHRPS